VIVALGGGVGGRQWRAFAAATWLRGIAVVSGGPPTLLAMVDAANRWQTG